MPRPYRVAAVLAALAFVSVTPASLAQQQNPEVLRLELEREKWRGESQLRTRELALKEREQANKDAELELKRREQASSKWTNPLVVAILAAAVAALGSAIVAVVNGRLQRELEESKAESTRILEMIKTGDPEAAAKNLSFLLQTGLVSRSDPAIKLRRFLETREPGAGPSLPAPTSRIGFEPTESLTPSLKENVQRNLGKYIAYLDGIGFPTDTRKANIKIYKFEPPSAQYVNDTLEIDIRFAEDPYAALREYGHHLLMGQMPSRAWSPKDPMIPIESGLADYFAGSFLNNPRVGEVIAKIIRLDRPYVRILENDRKFSEYDSLPEHARIHDGGEIWSGAFWEMRSHIGMNAMDPILAGAWLSAATSRHGQGSPRSFVETLLTMAGAKASKDQVDTIWDVLNRREFPLPKSRRPTTA